ncbi:MAG: acyltransferase family protein, partial [Clostridiaceae bacterium]
YITYLFESMFLVGVNCFVLITGYFQIDKSFIKASKIIRILISMLSYALLFYVIAVAIGALPLTLKELGKALLPFFIDRRWFIEVYIILILLSPFINIGLNNCNKKNFRKYLFIMFLFFSIWPSFLPSSPVTDNGYGIITFVMLYSVGAYLRKFSINLLPKIFYFLGFIMCASFTFLCSLFLKEVLGIGRIWGYNFIFIIAASVFLFIYFSKIHIQSKVIIHIAKFTLGVYFVHTDPSIISILYKYILHCDEYWNNSLFLLHAFGSIVLIYISGTIIDIIKEIAFEIVTKFIIIPIKDYFHEHTWISNVINKG